ncbi:MAG: ATP-binding protein [Elusimicrobiota bacterium]
MNPFLYGEFVKGSAFINREKEIKDLERDLSDSQKIFLISPRRYGKTSLVLRVKHDLEQKGIKVAYIDLFKCSSVERLAAALAKELSKFESVTFEKVFKFIKDIISALRPIISIDKEGEVSVQIDAKPKEQETFNILEDLLNYAQRYAEKHHARVVILLDEFQEVLKFSDQKIEKFLRAIVQAQDKVGYVFCGSKKEIIEGMVMNKSRAFYGIGPVISLDKINTVAWEKYLSNTFSKHGFKYDDKIPGLIVQKAHGIPYYIQYLAHELYDNYFHTKKFNIEHIDETIKTIVKRNLSSYETIWENLTGVQQRMLEGIASETIENIFSNDFLLRHQIGTRPGAEKTVKLLVKKDILEKEKNRYVISDIWFYEWIKYNILRNTSSS